MNVLRCYKHLLLCLMLMLTMPAAAFAGPVCLPESTKSEEIADTFQCSQEVGITYRFTECVNQLLHHVADTGFDKVINGVSKAVGAVLTLFVAFTGIKLVLGGVRNMKGEALTTLLKLAFVAVFALNTGGAAGESGVKKIYDLVQGMNAALVNTVSGTLISSGPCSLAEDGTPETNLWKRVDCTIFTFIGRSMPTYTTTVDEHGNTIKKAQLVLGPKDPNCDGNIVMAPKDDFSLFEIGLSQLFTPHGIFIIFLLGAAALMVFIAFAKALMVYTVAFVAITFLMLLAPIFIPLILFNRTRLMFMSWFAMLLGYTIQPAMLMAFLVFFLASMNVALHGDMATGTPGLKHSLALMNSQIEANQCTRKVLAWSQNTIKGEGADNPINDFQATIRAVGEEVNAVTVPVTPVPYKDLALFMVHLIACCVLLYVLMALMANVADFVASLSAGVGSNLARFGGGMHRLGGAAHDALKSGLSR